jgi:hypothetical protein
LVSSHSYFNYNIIYYNVGEFQTAKSTAIDLHDLLLFGIHDASREHQGTVRHSDSACYDDNNRDHHDWSKCGMFKSAEHILLEQRQVWTQRKLHMQTLLFRLTMRTHHFSERKGHPCHRGAQLRHHLPHLLPLHRGLPIPPLPCIFNLQVSKPFFLSFSSSLSA